MLAHAGSPKALDAHGFSFDFCRPVFRGDGGDSVCRVYRNRDVGVVQFAIPQSATSPQNNNIRAKRKC